jgi:hypothetical protein
LKFPNLKWDLSPSKAFAIVISFPNPKLALCYSPHLTHTLGVVFTFVLFPNTKAKNAFPPLLHTFLVLDLNHYIWKFVIILCTLTVVI